MKKSLTTLLLLLSCLLTLTVPAHSQDRVYLEIGSTDVRKINFAVPWFRNRVSEHIPEEFGKSLADTLAKALKFHGIINIVPTKLYNGSQTGDWNGLGVDFTVLGLYETTAGSLKLELRLFDVSSDKMILGKSYSGKRTQLHEMLYRFCDSVIKDLTGSTGLGNTQIAFVSQGSDSKKKELFVTDILGKKLRQVTRHRNLVVSPRFIPNSSFITYTSYHSGNQNLYITNLRQNRITRVLSRRDGMNLAPGWFPDGDSMLLTLSYEGNPDLYLVNRDGKINHQITKNAGINVSATISPDGKRAVFVSDRSGSPQLYLIDFSTKRTQRITFTGTENAEPDWHPSEDLIVFSSLRDGVYQICTMSPSRVAETNQLTTELSHHESPSWSPDGNQIVFSKQDGRNNKIYAMLKDGSFERPLFSFAGNQSYPRWSYNY